MKTKPFFLVAALAWTVGAASQVVIAIDANERGAAISPTHYGIFFEDINHAADGGLYAELIRNRSFEDGPSYGAPADMQAWSTYAAAPSTLQARLIQPSKKTPLLNAVQGNALELTVDGTAKPVCLVNEGFWGINAVDGREYRLSFWAKGNYKGTITATLTSKDGSVVYASSKVEAPLTKTWTKYTATLKAEGNNPKAQFVLVFDGKGVLALDMVSLFPPTFKNRENGMRPDLASMLAQMHPKFMRFPGGCFVEGQISPENAFRWERTVGPIEERPGHWNVNWGYRTTDGIGFHEYLQLAEDLGAKPLYVVNVGLWHGGLTPVDSLQPWIDETLAALEYANGPVTSKYGALRAKNGHPQPFNIEYLEIGNENNQPDPRQQSDHYYDRFKKFKDQVLAKYPQMHLIGNVVAWGDDNPQWGSSEPVELLDEHYYRNPSWFANAFHKYDTYARGKSKIYVGEYAVTDGFGDLGNLNAALGEAVYMMGMENNSDVVPLNSYAPIFVNENDARWRPDMIRFNSYQVMGTPSYYVQMLMPRNVGTRVVKVRQSDAAKSQKPRSLTPSKSRVGFATWATQASFADSREAGSAGAVAIANTGSLDFIGGQWRQQADGSIAQTAEGQRLMAVSKTAPFTSDHYTFKCRARKDSGDEGFLIVFNYVDENNFCWLNFGGWGNTQHAIEQISSTGKNQTVTRRGRVEPGRWYDVTLQVSGDSVKAWLDRDLVFDTVLKRDNSLGVYSSATVDERSGELTVKIVNNSPEGTTARLDLSHFTPKTALLTRLSSANGTDENTLQQPTNIAPVESVLSPQGNSVLVDVPAFSLNIVRLRQ